MAERKQCECGKKARMNQDKCLDCLMVAVKADPWLDKTTAPPTREEIRDMILRERGGKGIVKPALSATESTPQAAQDEPHCGRCGKPRSQVKVWIEKREKCQNCLSAECAAARRARGKENRGAV